jgi:hypothetical protein
MKKSSLQENIFTAHGWTAVGAMEKVEALALIGEMLQGEPSHGRYCHLDAAHYMLYGEPRTKHSKGVSKTAVPPMARRAGGAWRGRGPAPAPLVAGAMRGAAIPMRTLQL